MHRCMYDHCACMMAAMLWRIHGGCIWVLLDGCCWMAGLRKGLRMGLRHQVSREFQGPGSIEGGSPPPHRTRSASRIDAGRDREKRRHARVGGRRLVMQDLAGVTA